MSNLIDSFANRLKYAITIKNIKPIELSKKTNISKTNISCYMSGKYEAKQDGVKLLSEALDVNPVWLMGYDVPMEKEICITTKNCSIDKIPILCTIKENCYWLSEENVIGYITDKETIKSYEKNINEYYGLNVSGESMLPLLNDGDLVIFHKQDDVESGQTAIILIENENAIIRKVIKTNEGIELHAMNPYYPVRKFTYDKMDKIPVKIIGRVKEAKIKKAFE